MARMIVALIGKKGSGKSYIAKHVFGDHTVVRFADSLKKCVSTLYGIHPVHLDNNDFKKEYNPLRLTWVKLEIVSNHFKIPMQFCEDFENTELITPRRALQFIGTEIARAYDKEIHVKSLISSLKHGVDYVIDDCRFYNELKALRKFDPSLHTIYLLGGEEGDTHASEVELEHLRQECHYVTTSHALTEFGTPLYFEDSEKPVWN